MILFALNHKSKSEPTRRGIDSFTILQFIVCWNLFFSPFACIFVCRICLHCFYMRTKRLLQPKITVLLSHIVRICFRFRHLLMLLLVPFSRRCYFYYSILRLFILLNVCRCEDSSAMATNRRIVHRHIVTAPAATTQQQQQH